MVTIKQTKQLDLAHIRIPDRQSYIFDTYEIKQDDKVLAKVIARYYYTMTEANKKGGDPVVFILNSKGGRVAYINSFPTLFRVHNGKKEYKKNEAEFLTEKSATKKIRSAVQWLVDNNKL